MNPLRLASLLLLLGAVPAAAQLWEVDNQLLYAPAGGSGYSFGDELAVGDFDADGYDDLAVGSSLAVVGGTSAGRVIVYRGGPEGLSTTLWTSFDGAPGARFGRAIAVGDFDTDAQDELAIGAPDEDETVGEDLFQASGRVHVYELVAGVWVLDASFSQAGSVPGAVESGDRFGFQLATGDFDDDGFDDLAVGVVGEAVGAVQGAGAVNVLYGTAGGLAVAGSQIWHRSDGGVPGTAAENDSFGEALAAADFDGEGTDDLAVGSPTRTLGADDETGTVVVLYGGDVDGLTETGLQELDLSDLGFEAAGSEWFGSALGAGELNSNFACLIGGSCAADLVIGAPGQATEFASETIGGAGVVHVVPGNGETGGLEPGSATSIDAAAAVGGEPDHDGLFGTAIAVGRVDTLSNLDVVVGTPNQESATGQAAFFSGGSIALDDGQLLWARPGFESAPATADDRWGSAVAIGDFDGDGVGDLAVGIPERDTPAAFNGGAVQILYGALFADGFERGDSSAWP